MSRSPNFKFRSFSPSAHIATRDPFKLERRCEPRYADEGSLSASYSSAPDAPAAFGITHLQIIDRSPRGLGATSRTPIRPGSRVTICPEGSTIPWLAATAVRCEPCAEGFRIGLKYSGAAAAA